MNLRIPRIFPALAAALNMFPVTPAVANTSPTDIQAALDTVFGPWEVVNIDQRGNVFNEAWRKVEGSLALDGADAALAIMMVDGANTWHHLYMSFLTITGTVTGPATLNFSYFSDSQGYLGLKARVGHAELPLLGRWGEGSIEIPAGTHQVSWKFNAYGTIHGLDQVWTDDDPRPRLVGVDAYAWRQDDAVTVDLATNKPCFAFTATGLPPGVTINESSGQLTGTPSTSGSFLTRITARNEAGTHTKEYLIRVAPALPPPPGHQIPLAAALDYAPWKVLPRTGNVFMGGVVEGAIQIPWSGAVTELARDGTDAAVVVLAEYQARHDYEYRAFSSKLRTVVDGPGVFSIWHRAATPPPLLGVTAIPVAVVFDHWINGVYFGNTIVPTAPETPVITDTWVERKLTLPTGRHAIELAAQAIATPDGLFNDPSKLILYEPTTVLFDQASFHSQPVYFTFQQWLVALGQWGLNNDVIPLEVLRRDDEADGLGLLIEYALGGSPAFPDSARLPETSIVDGHLTLTVLKAPGTSGLEYTVQTNPSLAGNGWTTFGTEIMDEDATRLVVRCRKAVSEQPACYLRLQVRLEDPGG